MKGSTMRNEVILLFVFMLLTAGCIANEPPAAEPAAAPLPASQVGSDKVIAEAVIEPVMWSDLQFEVGGTVAEILVEPGDLVAAGDVLVRLDATAAELRVQEDRAAVASAEASLALAQARPRAEEIAQAEAQVEDGEAAVARAVAQRDQLAGGATEAAIADAEADVAAAQVALSEAQENHRQVHENSEDRDELEEADFRLFAAEEALAAAQAELDALQSTARDRLREADAAVRSAMAQQEVAEAQLDLLGVGSPPWEIATAEATVRQARTALASAEAALDRKDLEAPFSGTITRVNVEVGDAVAQGQPVAVLAKLDELQARTIDLTELAVVTVAEGQAATVRVDAQPNMAFSGAVRQVALRPGDHRGDVVYAVDVHPTETEGAPLRWGMTAVVEIDTD